MSLKKAIIIVAGDIDSDSYGHFSEALRELEMKGYKELGIELSSGGGDAYSALAFYDRIQSTPIIINITATGLVASAATLIFVAGAKRYMTKNAWLMVHEDTISGIDNLKVSQLEKEAKHARRLEEQWVELFFKSTGIRHKIWENYNREETYLTSEECLKLGFIDGIV